MTIYKYLTDDVDGNVKYIGEDTDRLKKNSIIPSVIGNIDYNDFLQWRNEGNTPLPYKTDKEFLDDAYKDKIKELDEEKEKKNKENISYLHNGTTYIFLSDYDSMKDVVIEIITQNLIDSDLIPVPNGEWRTEEIDENTLEPIYVIFTCGEFKIFNSSMFDKKSKNFKNKDKHKSKIDKLYKQGDIDKIKNYDVSTDWE